MGDSYPTDRPPFFAQKVLRTMVKCCAMQEIGPEGFALVALVVVTEDAARYRRPITWHNGQLLPLLGLAKWERLDRIRKLAVKSGWLKYLPPPKGSRSPGRYWADIPPFAMELGDTPVDEGSSSDQSPKAYPENGYGSGDSVGDGLGEHSYLPLSPNSPPSTANTQTKPKAHSPKATRSDPAATDQRFEAWYAAYPRRVAKEAARKSHSKAVALVAKRDGISLDDAAEWLVGRTQAFAKGPIGQGEPKFIPYPATWLNAGRFDDETLNEPKRAGLFDSKRLYRGETENHA